MSRWCLLQRWQRRCRAAAAAAFPLRRAGCKWRGANETGHRSDFHHAVIKLFKIVWNWLDDRLGISVLLSPMKPIAPQDSKWWYVFGSATLVAFVVQVASSVALSLSSISSSPQSYETLLFITNNAP